jgi:hypothetical protein
VDTYVPRSERQLVDVENGSHTDEALSSAFEYCGIAVEVSSLLRQDLIHGRRLLIAFTDGTQICVVPDQGMAYWTLARSQWRTPVATFGMHESPAVLGERLAEIKIGVAGADLPTLVSTDRMTRASGTAAEELAGVD